MTPELKFSKSHFARILAGSRDFDFQRQLAAAVRAGIEEYLRDAIPADWIRIVWTGREEFQLWEGRLRSAHFHLKNIHAAGGFFGADFKVQLDVPKGATVPVEDVIAGPGVEYSNEMSRFDDRRLPPKVTFRGMSKWDRHCLHFYALHLDPTLLPLTAEECRQCTCPTQYLRPVTISPTCVLSWLCICCGKQYLCECYRGVNEKLSERENFDNKDYVALQQATRYRENICHLCREMPAQVKFRSEMYGGPIYQNYFPYIQMEAVLHEIDYREAENRVRDRLSIPRIGEGWVNEMLVVKTVRHLFPYLTVEHQASPQWLGRQRFDAYIAEKKVAIEYNGEQHYQSVDLFGGAEGLAATQARDQRKLQLADQHGVEVIVFSHNESLSEELIQRRVQAAIDRQEGRRGATANSNS